MPPKRPGTPPDLSRALAELGNALQSAVLLARGLERALADTHWRAEAIALRRAVDRAAAAVHDIGELARPSRPYTSDPPHS